MKSLTRKSAIRAQQGSGGRGGFCTNGLQNFLDETGLPGIVTTAYRYTPTPADISKKIEPDPPLVVAHYTDEGLRYHWDILSQEVDAWIADVRRLAIKGYNDKNISLIRLRTFFRLMRMEPPRERFRVSTSTTLDWSSDDDVDLTEVRSYLRAVMEKIVSDQNPCFSIHRSWRRFRQKSGLGET